MLVGLLSCFWELIGSTVGTLRVTSPEAAFSGAGVSLQGVHRHSRTGWPRLDGASDQSITLEKLRQSGGTHNCAAVGASFMRAAFCGTPWAIVGAGGMVSRGTDCTADRPPIFSCAGCARGHRRLL